MFTNKGISNEYIEILSFRLLFLFEKKENTSSDNCRLLMKCSLSYRINRLNLIGLFAIRYNDYYKYQLPCFI